MTNISPPGKQMFSEVVLDIRMSFAFLYAAYQLSSHCLGIHLYEVQDDKHSYFKSHKKRLESEQSMLTEALRCAQIGVNYTKSIKRVWFGNETFFSTIVDTIEAYIEYIRCQLDENSLLDLIETSSEQLLEEKHGELFEKSGVITEKIRLRLISILKDIQQEDKIKIYKLDNKRFGALPNLLESLDYVYFELEKILAEELVAKD